MDAVARRIQPYPEWRFSNRHRRDDRWRCWRRRTRRLEDDRHKDLLHRGGYRASGRRTLILLGWAQKERGCDKNDHEYQPLQASSPIRVTRCAPTFSIIAESISIPHRPQGQWSQPAPVIGGQLATCRLTRNQEAPLVQLWNTLTRAKEEFVAGPIVRMYVCGITPYATTHLGHARTYLIFDVLIREIERRGHQARYTQNVTDVDDPLFERAQQLGVPTATLAQECTRIFQDDVAALRIRPPDYYPRASDEVPAMHELIGKLVDAGHAYASGDRVYFRIRSFPRYGEFSRLTRDEMLAVAAERGEDPRDPYKEDPLDFVLWKPSQPGEAAWPSPWGTGRPGWHIECSAMALRYLGAELDVHGGGSDLIYPHHEHEIAQSEAATGHAPLARYWIHAAMVRLGDTKMSKSLGNMVFVRDLRKRIGAVAIRHYLLTSHYRTELDYSEDDLNQSVARVNRLDRALAGSATHGESVPITARQNEFDAALADDLNTPLALKILDGAVDEVWGGEGNADSTASRAAVRRMAVRLGLAEDVE